MSVRAGLRALALLALLAPASARADWVATGSFQYRDRLQDLSGFTGVEPDRPARHVDVQIVDATTNAVLATGATDAAGAYAINVVDAQVRSVRARMVSLSSATPGLLIDVRNNTSARQAYAVTGSAVAGHAPAANLDFGVVTALPGAGGEAFNVFDVLLDGCDFYATLQGGGWPPLRLTAFWQAGATDGTFFTPGDNSLHLRGGEGYDDTVIGHEQGHFVARNWSNDDTPGGTHFIGDDHQDLRLAWSEGWATFFASAARRARGAGPLPPAYIDTDGAPGAGGLNFSFEIEGPNVEANGGASEVAVGAALWDIVDDAATADLTPGADDDGLARPLADVWDVVENVLPLPGVNQVSLEDFWDGWFRPGASKGDQPAMEAAFGALGIRYAPDAFEPDETFATAPVVPVTGAPQARTFYGLGDVDHARFTAGAGESFVVETTDLLSDGNTHLTVYAPDQATVIATNDDRTASDPSSRVTFTAPQAGTYYARLVHAADLGVYGSYTLRVLKASDPAATAFTEVAAATGVANTGNSRGAAWGDVDGDGDPDLFVTNLGGAAALYRNQGGVFTDRAAAWGAAVADGEGAAWADYDKDGDLDLVVTTAGGLVLLQSRRADSGDSVFVDVTAAAGLARPFAGRSAAWGDADRDGLVDLYVTDADGAPALFRNLGNGTFADVAAAAGVAFPGASVSAAWCDYDRDGDDDLYVVGNGTHSRLYRNALRQTGQLAFDDVTALAGVAAGLGGFACEWADQDGDGRLDLYVADGGGFNHLYRNRGDGAFDDVTLARNAGGGQFSVTGAFGDIDNDGDLDLFVGKLAQPGLAGFNQLYENVAGQFSASPQLAGSTATRSATWADYDRDGDLDLYVALANGQANQLWRNDSTNPRRVEVTLLGRASNRDGFGATVRVRTGPRVQHRVVSGGSGFGSQHSAALEFGLASGTKADSLIVDWPSGKRTTLAAVPAGTVLVDEATAVAAGDADAPRALALAGAFPQPAPGGRCRIAFTVPGGAGTGPVAVRLRLLDAAGRQRRVLLDEARTPGPAALAFDGADARGARLPAGLYFLEFAAGDARATRKLVVLPDR